MPAPQTCAADYSNGSTAGLQKLIGGSSPSAIMGPLRAAHDAHVAAARRHVDPCRRTTGFALLASRTRGR